MYEELDSKIAELKEKIREKQRYEQDHLKIPFILAILSILRLNG